MYIIYHEVTCTCLLPSAQLIATGSKLECKERRAAMHLREIAHIARKTLNETPPWCRHWN